MQNIPGGASTQIAQQSGGLVESAQPPMPRQQGLAIDQQRMGQAVMAANPEPPMEEPIPIWEESGPLAEPEVVSPSPRKDPYEDPIAPEEPEPEDGRVHFDFTDNDSGEVFRIWGDEGATREEALQFLQSVPEDKLKEYRISGAEEPELRDYLRAQTEGTLWGWGTEATAFLGASAAKIMGDETPFAEIYTDILGAEEYELDRFRKEHPVKAYGTEIGGALLTGGVGAKALQLGAKTGTAKAAAAYGASSGAIYGAGAAGQDNRLVGATTGAVGGAVLGPAVHGATKGVQKYMAGKVERKLKTSKGAEKLGKEYWAQVWTNRAMGMSSLDAFKAARKNLGLNTEQVLRMSHELDPKIYHNVNTAQQAMDKLAESKLLDVLPRHMQRDLSKVADDFIRPIDSRIRDISPAVYRLLMRLERVTYDQMHQWHVRVKPFRDLHRSMRRSQFMTRTSDKDSTKMGLALANKNYEEAARLAEKHAGADGRKVIMDLKGTLEEIGGRMKANGIEFDAIDDYFPRHVINIQKLKNYLNTSEQAKGYRKALAAERRRLGGRELTLGEEEKLINRFLSHGTIKKITMTTGATKKRKVQKITEELRQFYADPITSIDLHIRDASGAIARHQFFGKSMVKTNHGSEDIGKTVGNMVDGMKLSANQMDELKSLLNARFGMGEQSGYRTLSNLRQISGGVTLGNPRSAIKQLGDVLVVAGHKGIVNVIKAAIPAMKETYKGARGIESKNLNADIFGWMLEMAQELDTGPVTSNLLKKGASNLYRLGGFKLVDRFGKNVTIQSSFNKAKNQLKSEAGRRRFVEQYGGTFGADDVQRLMKDIADENAASDLVKDWIFMEVTRFQPITRSQMSKHYLNHPNLRGLAQFKTWGMRQIDMLRTDIVRGLYSENPRRRKESARQLVMLTTYLGIGGGLTIPKIQQFISGQEDSLEGIDEFSEEMFWGVIGNFAIDRYNIERSIDMGDIEPLTQAYGVMPSFSIPGEFIVRAAQAITPQDDDLSTPMINEEWEEWRKLLRSTGMGRYIDYVALGGGEEWTERRAEQRHKQRMEKLIR